MVDVAMMSFVRAHNQNNVSKCRILWLHPVILGDHGRRDVG